VDAAKLGMSSSFEDVEEELRKRHRIWPEFPGSTEEMKKKLREINDAARNASGSTCSSEGRRAWGRGRGSGAGAGGEGGQGEGQSIAIRGMGRWG